MRPLLTLSARWAALASVLIFGIAALGGLVRLLPWLVAPEVPLGVAAPFAELLAARGVEVSVLIGFPMGVGIAASLFVERGEARALAALGAPPLRLAGSVAPLGLCAMALCCAVSPVEQRSGSARLANALVQSGRAACDHGAFGTRRIDVPLLSLSWLCFAGGPRLVGGVPGLASRSWFTGRDLRVAPGDRAFEVEDLYLASTFSSTRVTLHAATARFSGLAGWRPAGPANGIARAVAIGAAAMLSAFASAWAVVRTGLGSPIGAAAGSGSAGVASLTALRALDDAGIVAPRYVLILPAGALFALVVLGIAAAISGWRIAGRKA